MFVVLFCLLLCWTAMSFLCCLYVDDNPQMVGASTVVKLVVSILAGLVATAGVVVSYLVVAGIFWLICWAFGLAWFAWKTAFGIWLVLLLLWLFIG